MLSIEMAKRLVLATFCVLSLASIGLFFVPAAVLMTMAAARTSACSSRSPMRGRRRWIVSMGRSRSRVPRRSHQGVEVVEQIEHLDRCPRSVPLPDRDLP